MSKKDVKVIVGSIDRVSWCREKKGKQLYYMAKVIEKLTNFLNEKNLSFNDINEYFELKSLYEVYSMYRQNYVCLFFVLS